MGDTHWYYSVDPSILEGRYTIRRYYGGYSLILQYWPFHPGGQIHYQALLWGILTDITVLTLLSWRADTPPGFSMGDTHWYYSVDPSILEGRYTIRRYYGGYSLILQYWPSHTGGQIHHQALLWGILTDIAVLALPSWRADTLSGVTMGDTHWYYSIGPPILEGRYTTRLYYGGYSLILQYWPSHPGGQIHYKALQWGILTDITVLALLSWRADTPPGFTMGDTHWYYSIGPPILEGRYTTRLYYAGYSLILQYWPFHPGGQIHYQALLWGILTDISVLALSYWRADTLSGVTMGDTHWYYSTGLPTLEGRYTARRWCRRHMCPGSDSDSPNSCWCLKKKRTIEFTSEVFKSGRIMTDPDEIEHLYVKNL